MIVRKTSWMAAALVALLLVLTLSGSGQAESPRSPRDNPDLRARMSGIVVVDANLESGPALPVEAGPRLADGLVPLGPNVFCNQDLAGEPHNEPSIVVNPQNPNHVIASSNDYRNLGTGGDVQPGYYVSFDGGLTWPGDGVIDLSPIPQAAAGGDPALAIYDENNVYFAYIAFHRTLDDVGGVFVSTSADGGLTWGNPVEVAANTLAVFHDKEYIAVDATGSPYDSNVYVSWTRFSSGSPIYVSRSTDGGATFSTPMQISDYSSNQGSIPGVGPNGEVYVVWYCYNTGGQRMSISTNGGLTFGTPFHVANVNAIPSPLPGGNFRVNSFPTLAVDQTTGNLYVAWNDYANGDADVFFVRSTDGGLSWSSPQRLNDDGLSNARHQFFPWLTVAPDGTVYAGWFDSRHDAEPYSAPFYFDEYVTRSTDGGQTWSPNARISDQSANASTDFSGQFIGDYSGIAANNDFVYPAWVDTRRGHQDIYTQANLLKDAVKVGPATVEQGQVLTYTLLLSSTAAIAEARLTDPLPPEVTYVPGSLAASAGTYGQAGGVVTWTGALTGHEPVTLTFQVTPTAVCDAEVLNQAIVTGSLATVRIWLTTQASATPVSLQADFAPSAVSLDLSQAVTFTNETSGTPPIDFLWSFGDGLTSTLPAPSHAYSLPGAYTVTLTATDACATDAHSEVLTVTCAPPAAAFAWMAEYLTVTFTNETTGVLASDYHWDFGDGLTSTLPAPVHAYAQAGAYTVTLTATSPCGIGSYADLVTVEHPPRFVYLPLVVRE